MKYSNEQNRSHLLKIIENCLYPYQLKRVTVPKHVLNVVLEILTVFVSRLAKYINLLDIESYKIYTMILQSNLEQTTDLTDVIIHSTDIFENDFFQFIPLFIKLLNGPI